MAILQEFYMLLIIRKTLIEVLGEKELILPRLKNYFA